MKMKLEMVRFFDEKDWKRDNVKDKSILDIDNNLEINTVRERRKFIDNEISLYNKSGKSDLLNSGLPHSLPIRLALLY